MATFSDFLDKTELRNKPFVNWQIQKRSSNILMMLIPVNNPSVPPENKLLRFTSHNIVIFYVLPMLAIWPVIVTL